MAEAAGTTDAAREAGAERSFRLLLLALCLVGAALRGVHLDTTLSHDEVETVKRYVEGGPDTILATHGGYGSTNNHLLNSLLAWASVRAFGMHVWSLRLPSYAFGALAVGLVGWVARILTRERSAAAIAAFLAALSPPLVAYATACRGYGTLVFFALLALGSLVLAVERGERRWLLVLGPALLAAGWSHMTGLVFAAACGLCALVLLAIPRRAGDPLRGARRPALLALATILVAGAALTAWYSRESLILRDVGNRVVNRTFVDPSLANVRSMHYEAGLRLWALHTAKEFLGATGWLVLLGGPLAMAGVLVVLWRDARRGALLACCLLFPPTAFLAGGLKPYPRYFLFVQPFVLVALGASLAWLARALAARAPWPALRRPAVAAAVLALAFELTSLPWLRASLSGPGARLLNVDWDVAGAVEEVARELRPDDVVLTFPRPEVRADWREWAFEQSCLFHEQLSLSPILSRPAREGTGARTLWYITPERRLQDLDRFPFGCTPEPVSEHWGTFLYRAEIVCPPLADVALPPLDLAGRGLGAWRIEDDFQNVTPGFGPGSGPGDRIALAVGHAGGDARVISPPFPIAAGALVELSAEVAAEQSDGMRPCATIAVRFQDEAGERIVSVARNALLWEGLRPRPDWSLVRLTTIAPRSARTAEVCLSLAPGHPAGSVIEFRPPRLRVAGPER